jgi:hypothetical protein
MCAETDPKTCLEMVYCLISQDSVVPFVAESVNQGSSAVGGASNYVHGGEGAHFCMSGRQKRRINRPDKPPRKSSSFDECHVDAILMPSSVQSDHSSG